MTNSPRKPLQRFVRRQESKSARISRANNRWQDRMDEAADAKRLHGGETLQQFLDRQREPK